MTTSDHIARAAEVLGEGLGDSYSRAVCRLLARRLDAAGLLATPEHDAAVAAKATDDLLSLIATCGYPEVARAFRHGRLNPHRIEREGSTS